MNTDKETGLAGIRLLKSCGFTPYGTFEPVGTKLSADQKKKGYVEKVKLDKNLPAEKSVYAIVVRDKYVGYIGSSRDLQERIAHHSGGQRDQERESNPRLANRDPSIGLRRHILADKGKVDLWTITHTEPSLDERVRAAWRHEAFSDIETALIEDLGTFWNTMHQRRRPTKAEWRLRTLGFKPYGSWVLNNDKKSFRYEGVLPPENGVYTFVLQGSGVKGRIGYIGSGKTGVRVPSYTKPGLQPGEIKYRGNSPKIYNGILDELTHGGGVQIWIAIGPTEESFAENIRSLWRDGKLYQTAEKALILRIGPKWMGPQNELAGEDINGVVGVSDMTMLYTRLRALAAKPVYSKRRQCP